ncbi:MAG: hypothetical protein Q4B03_08755 [Lachnospiraceae bacterium]|nr:hypothetical protein [Lachnospiraceae bacterium]
MRKYFAALFEQIKKDRKSFLVYSVLRALVIVTLIRCLFTRNYESAFLCVLSLVLFLLPSVFETTLHIEIPAIFENIIYLFIYAAEILGEINHYYVIIPGWDTMLHTMNGFLCAVVGFSLVDLLNRRSSRMKLSPAYLAMVAFCFSMTVGVLWEFFECFMDLFFMFDMQKDFVVSQFGSVTLDPNNSGAVVQVKNITDTIIHTASGESYTITGGYLDIGILDTMKDLFVNFIGAVVFSVIGFLYVANREKHKRSSRIAAGLVIRREKEV